jgi:hypothetical protein
VPEQEDEAVKPETKNEEGGEKLTERLNMFFTPSQVEAINDFRFSNRIGSLSEAVRQLIELGLEHSEKGKSNA